TTGALRRLLAVAREEPERTLLVCDGSRYTFASFLDQAAAVVRRLRCNGFARGDRVAVFCDDYDAFFMAMVGVWLAGGVVVPLNTTLPPGDIEELVARSGPAFLLVSPTSDPLPPSALDRLRQLVVDPAVVAGGGAKVAEAVSFTPVASPELAVIMFTSGSTGVPKGVMQTLGAVLGNAERVAAELELTAGDRIFVNTPPYFTSGICHFLTLLNAGGSFVGGQGFRFGVGLLAEMEEAGCTGFGGAPAHLVRVVDPLEHPVGRGALRFWVSSGDHLPVATIDRMREVLPGVALYNMYGLTEVSGRLCVLRPAETERRPGSVGRPIAGMTVAACRDDGSPVSPGDAGELFVKGDLLMQGYLDEPRLTAEALTEHGFRTGDVGYVDPDGYVWVTGRKDDIFKRGGEKVSSVHIQQAIVATGTVVDAVVLAFDDELLGKVPVAFVVPADAGSFTARGLMRELRSRLQPAWLPARILALDEIPRTGSGKAVRARLVEHAQAAGPQR
ncbi:MAG TPA: class I adenylate-forming enzyme family protein, partial [Thermoleophilia bacterium]|nr:class I adenylate-forming enzyme family protein [Thermoleophilia bacterium]